MQAVEQACTQMLNPHTHAAGESTLLAFMNSNGAVPACKFILENSNMAHAQFQAVTALREAALREWPLLTPAERLALREYILQQVVRCIAVTAHLPPP